MNTTTCRWLLASHIEQTRAHLQRLETELEKHDAAQYCADNIELAERFASRDETREKTIDEIADLLPPYKAGDPDPTPNLRLDDQCAENAPDDHYWVCTWKSGHAGDHVAGDGTEIWAVWPNTPPVPVEDLRAELVNEIENHPFEHVSRFLRGLSYSAPKDTD